MAEKIEVGPMEYLSETLQGDTHLAVCDSGNVAAVPNAGGGPAMRQRRLYVNLGSGDEVQER